MAENRGKRPGTLPFGPIPTGLKIDPGAFRFCQLSRIFAGFRIAVDMVNEKLMDYVFLCKMASNNHLR